MSILLLVARLLLAVVFVVAGLAKIADLKGSQKAVKGFGVPSFLAFPLGTILPFAELAVTVALIPTAWAFYGAIGAAVLLVVFIVGIGANLSVGRQPDCHCFGQLHSEPVGAPTLIRNVILAVVAGFVIWQGASYNNVGSSAVNWITTLTAFQAIALVVGVILVALVAIETWLLLQTMTQQGRLLTRLELLEENGVPANENNPAFGLPEDTPAPAFELPDLAGNLVSLSGILEQKGETKKAAFLVFTSPNCGPCQAMMPSFVEWQEKHANKLALVMISQGTVEKNRAKVAGYGVSHLLLQKDKEVADAYKVRGTPSGVAISYDGSTYGKLAEGEDNIKALLTEFTFDVEVDELLPNPLLVVNKPNNGMMFPVPPKIGDLAPDLSLLDLNDNLIKLSDFRGTPTLLLFWNPSCSFCQGMLKDLLIWEKEREKKPVKGTPQLLVISIGGTKTDNQIGFKSTVVLDDTPSSYSAARWFKAAGTPMAILLDKNG